MAIRYSGDVEVRLSYSARGEGSYRVHVRAPGFRRSLVLTAAYVGLSRKRTKEARTTPEAYDKATKAALQLVEVQDGLLPVELEAQKGKDVLVIRRVFQSACPRR